MRVASSPALSKYSQTKRILWNSDSLIKRFSSLSLHRIAHQAPSWSQILFKNVVLHIPHRYTTVGVSRVTENITLISHQRVWLCWVPCWDWVPIFMCKHKHGVCWEDRNHTTRRLVWLFRWGLRLLLYVYIVSCRWRSLCLIVLWSFQKVQIRN